ncbi:MAG TPA: APC family permease, partial [Thermoplasmata archaeon]|nr:APC family permease [Thermoplasmata archaeon]
MAHGRGGEVEVKLRRDLGLLEIVMIGFGPTIGSTVFLLIGPGYLIAGPSLILGFLLNFIVTMFTAMAYMELGSAFPETGGGYLWIRRAMRDPLGFLGGWMSWFSHTIVASFYIFGFGLAATVLLKVFLGLPSLVLALGPIVLNEADLQKLFAVAAAGAFIWLNYRGTRLTGRSETGVALGLIAIAVAFIAFGLLSIFRQPVFPVQNFEPFFRGTGAIGQSVALLGAMGFTFIVFEGYEIIAQTGEEVKHPERNIPPAHFIVIGVSTVIFILMAFAAVGIAGNCTPG